MHLAIFREGKKGFRMEKRPHDRWEAFVFSHADLEGSRRHLEFIKQEEASQTVTAKNFATFVPRFFEVLETDGHTKSGFKPSIHYGDELDSDEIQAIKLLLAKHGRAIGSNWHMQNIR